MGIKKGPRPKVVLKDPRKRHSLHNRSRIKPHTKKSRVMNKQQARMSFSSKGARSSRFSPLVKLLNRRGMAYGRRSILRTVHNDHQLRRKLLRRGIRSRKRVEDALLELLFQCRNLKDWNSGDDNLFNVFRIIKGRVKWAANCSVDLIMQLFFTLIRARLECPGSWRKKACKVALRVDKVISVSVSEALHLTSRACPIVIRSLTGVNTTACRQRDSSRAVVWPENLRLNFSFVSILFLGDLRANT